MALESSPPEIVSFATFDVNQRAGELRKPGQRVKLQDQPFQVLMTLLQRAGEVVTREDLGSHIWRALAQEKSARTWSLLGASVKACVTPPEGGL